MKKYSHALLFCNGDPPAKKIVGENILKDAFIVCADGGVNHALRLGIHPHLVIGDIDSMKPTVRKKMHPLQCIEIADQQTNDLEKVLVYLFKAGFRKVLVFGATGKRTDHTLTNFSVMLRFSSLMKIVFSDNYCDMVIMRKKTAFGISRGQILSLIPMTKCQGITTKGLQYPLLNETLEFGVREGLSNIAVSSTVTITMKKGALLLVIPRDKNFIHDIKKNDHSRRH